MNVHLEKTLGLAKAVARNVKNMLIRNRTGGSGDADYCYLVYMIHLKHYIKHKNKIPESVAEFGPGDSIGTGLCALLSGSKFLFLLDVVQYFKSEDNLKIFDVLVEKFRKNTPPPPHNCKI